MVESPPDRSAERSMSTLSHRPEVRGGFSDSVSELRRMTRWGPADPLLDQSVIRRSALGVLVISSLDEVHRQVGPVAVLRDLGVHDQVEYLHVAE